MTSQHPLLLFSLLPTRLPLVTSTYSIYSSSFFYTPIPSTSHLPSSLSPMPSISHQIQIPRPSSFSNYHILQLIQSRVYKRWRCSYNTALCTLLLPVKKLHSARYFDHQGEWCWCVENFILISRSGFQSPTINMRAKTYSTQRTLRIFSLKIIFLLLACFHFSKYYMKTWSW